MMSSRRRACAQRGAGEMLMLCAAIVYDVFRARRFRSVRLGLVLAVLAFGVCFEKKNYRMMRRKLAESIQPAASRAIRRLHFFDGAAASRQADLNNGLLLLSQHQSSPAPPPAATTAEGDLPRDKWRAGDLSTPPRPIFPWRHDPNLLPRLVGKNAKEGGKLGPGIPFTLTRLENVIVTFFCTQAGATLLNVPWYERLLGSQWKRDLADASGWAFAQAVAGVLSNTYRVPFGDIVDSDESNEDGLGSSISFDHTTKFKAAEDEEDVFSQTHYMMEEKLIHLYEAAHDSGKEQMRILLETKPLSCRIESLFMIPCLTRAAVAERPALRHTFRNMAFKMLELEKQGNFGARGAFSFMADQMKELVRERVAIHPDGYSVLEHTVVAQVLVECDELFGVKDLVTERMIQGDGLRRIVPHLVRLEMNVQTRITRQGSATNHMGSWIITDWDDLLEGNIWFV